MVVYLQVQAKVTLLFFCSLYLEFFVSVQRRFLIVLALGKRFHYFIVAHPVPTIQLFRLPVTVKHSIYSFKCLIDGSTFALISRKSWFICATFHSIHLRAYFSQVNVTIALIVFYLQPCYFMEKYVSYRVLRKVNDTSSCYFAHRLFSLSRMLLTTQSLLHFIFQSLIWSILKRTVENQEF